MTGFEPRILTFLCNWCSYAGADLVGVCRLSPPPSVRNIRVMCSGRVDPLWVIRVYLNGADGVLVAGCHPYDCHCARGNFYTRRRIAILKNIFETTGLEDDRLRRS